MNMKLIITAALFLGLAGCASLEERLGKRVGCDPTKIVVQKQLHVPAYNQYDFTCDGKPMVCRDAPFHSSCGPDTPKATADAKPADAAPAAADTKAADAKPADKKEKTKKK